MQSSEGFADFQMQKFLKQSQLSQKIDKVRKELNEQNVGQVAEIREGQTVETSRVASEDSSHYVLIKGLSQSRQQEMASSLAERDIDAVIKTEKIDKDDYWVEKRRQEARLPASDDFLPKLRRPMVKGEVNMSSESEEEEKEREKEETQPQRKIVDLSSEGGFFKEDELGEEEQGEEKKEFDEIDDDDLVEAVEASQSSFVESPREVTHAQVATEVHREQKEFPHTVPESLERQEPIKLDTAGE
jgi:hypothetical protein